MRWIWESKIFFKDTAMLLSREYVNNWVKIFPKWVSVSQRAAKLQAVKVGYGKKILHIGRNQTTQVRPAVKSQTMESFSKFEGPQLYNPLTYRGSQYLFGQI